MNVFVFEITLMISVTLFVTVLQWWNKSEHTQYYGILPNTTEYYRILKYKDESVLVLSNVLQKKRF